MRYGSVCSGIEAASLRWHPLGMQPIFFSEIEPFCVSVLEQRWPGIPIHGDFRTIGKKDYEPIDILVGGTPCQSFSSAGLRAGFDDDRGQLTMEFFALAHRLRPEWIVWENVPGVLSADKGRSAGNHGSFERYSRRQLARIGSLITQPMLLAKPLLHHAVGHDRCCLIFRIDLLGQTAFELGLLDSNRRLARCGGCFRSDPAASRMPDIRAGRPKPACRKSTHPRNPTPEHHLHPPLDANGRSATRLPHPGCPRCAG